MNNNKMKIVHICMVDAFSDGWAYHRNVISDKNKADGHDVTVITTKYRMRNDGMSELDRPGVSYTKSGVKVIRLNDIVPFLPMAVQEKLHWTRGLYDTLSGEDPDIIMIHNPQFVNLRVVARYRRAHPNIRLIGDTHADRFVSIGKNPRKSVFVNKRIWGPIIRKNFQYFDRFCYIGLEQRQFFEDMYGIDLKDAIFAPLPAPIIGKERKLKYQKKIRSRHNIAGKELLLIHSGKLTKRKKTGELLEALSKSDLKCRLFIIGEIPDEERSELLKLVASEARAEYLGWKSGDELREYLAAADLYLQPGTMSVTMQNALCVGTPVMIYPHDSYQFYCRGCDFQVKSVDDMINVFNKLSLNNTVLQEMSLEAYKVAEKYFSIENAAQIIYGVSL